MRVQPRFGFFVQRHSPRRLRVFRCALEVILLIAASSALSAQDASIGKGPVERAYVAPPYTTDGFAAPVYTTPDIIAPSYTAQGFVASGFVPSTFAVPEGGPALAAPYLYARGADLFPLGSGLTAYMSGSGFNPGRPPQLFDSPGPSLFQAGRGSALAPFTPGFGVRGREPAPLFPVAGVSNGVSETLPSLNQLMHGNFGAPAGNVRYARAGILSPGVNFTDPEHPSAATLFGTTDLGNGMIFSAGTNFGGHAGAGAPAATLGNNASGAHKQSGPSVALKLSF